MNHGSPSFTHGWYFKSFGEGSTKRHTNLESKPGQGMGYPRLLPSLLSQLLQDNQSHIWRSSIRGAVIQAQITRSPSGNVALKPKLLLIHWRIILGHHNSVIQGIVTVPSASAFTWDAFIHHRISPISRKYVCSGSSVHVSKLLKMQIQQKLKLRMTNT